MNVSQKTFHKYHTAESAHFLRTIHTYSGKCPLSEVWYAESAHFPTGVVRYAENERPVITFYGKPVSTMSSNHFLIMVLSQSLNCLAKRGRK